MLQDVSLVLNLQFHYVDGTDGDASVVGLFQLFKWFLEDSSTFTKAFYQINETYKLGNFPLIVVIVIFHEQVNSFQLCLLLNQISDRF